MFWPFILPMQITAGGLVVGVLVLTAASPRLKWRRSATFAFATLLATLAFVPSCMLVQAGVDAVRFGRFEYGSVAEIDDFRALRYLPEAAVDIEMHKYANGYTARYAISETDFHAYLDGLWETYGSLSAVERGGYAGEGSAVKPSAVHEAYGKYGWPALENAVRFYSPTEPDGGGAVYLYDSEAGVAYQGTGYW